MSHYVRTYEPESDREEWFGPMTAYEAGFVAERFEGRRQTRVYDESELGEAES